MTKIPKELFERMKIQLQYAHMDENVGVPIGARMMALDVIRYFEEGIDSVAFDLGPIHQLPRDWARERCTNPVRARKGDIDD